MAQPAQTVIYRLCEPPMWHFYSMPESIVGGGRTLDGARDHYRDALNFSLGADQLPKIREYIEREADNLGIWIRTQLASPNGDNAFEQITRQITSYPDEDREWFYHHASAGGDPVVVPGAPDDDLSSIFDQMTPFDSLIVVMAHSDGGKLRVVWLVVEGTEATREDSAEPPLSLSEFGLTPDSLLREVFGVAMQHYGNKPAALLAPA